MIRDRLVLGITNTRVRKRLLREDNLNLDNAVKQHIAFVLIIYGHIVHVLLSEINYYARPPWQRNVKFNH